jgi:hypothetical protein
MNSWLSTPQVQFIYWPFPTQKRGECIINLLYIYGPFDGQDSE